MRITLDIQRLLAGAIACKIQRLLLSVPNGEGKHAFEPTGQTLAPLAVAVQKNFRIAVIGAEAMPALLEFAAQIAVVIDFAVEDDGEVIRTAG